MSPPPSRGRIVAVAALLLVSGAAALLHESAWFRMLVPVLGAGALPSAVVAAGALLGIGTGSVLGGRLADRAARPARVLALGEIAAAATGLLVPPALRLLESFQGTTALLAATLLLALAAVPWGVSIPAAVRTIAAPADRVGGVFGRLYAWNTVGAVLGIAASAVWLFEAFGNRGTVTVAAGLQVVAALAALALATGPVAAVEPEVPAAAAEPQPARTPVALMLAAALAGIAGIGMQVAWMRRLTPILGATFPVFAAVLAIHLAGIALGSALLGPRRGARPVTWIVTLAVVACLATAGTPLVLDSVADFARRHWWSAERSPASLLLVDAGVAAVLVLPGVLAGSALLPWLVRLRAPDAAHGGRGSGALLAANTAGGAAGGLAVALWLVPGAGTAGSLAVCAAALLLAGACVASGFGRWALVVLGGMLAAEVFVSPPQDAAFFDAVGSLTSLSGYRPADSVTLLAKDGRNASVLVRDRDGRIEFWIEGSLEASNWPTDRLHLGLLGHLPLVLWQARSDARPNVVLVGLGGGFTAQAAVPYDPASLTVYELEPQVAHAAEIFRDQGGGLPESAKLVFADGRKAVATGTGPIDVLSSDAIHPAVAGSAYLYSQDYWRAAMDRLSPDGILLAWLPLYRLHLDDVRLTMRTFAASVDHPYLFLAGADGLLIGTRTPLRLSAERLARVLQSPAAAALREEGLGTPGRLMSLLALDPEGFRAIAGEGDLNTDDRLLLELRSGWRGDLGAAEAHVLLTSRPADPRTLLDAPSEAAFEVQLAVGARITAALGTWARWEIPAAVEAFTDLAEREPANKMARRMRDESVMERAWQFYDDGVEAEAAALARQIGADPAAEPIRRLDAAQILAGLGFPAEARAIAKPYALAHPWPRAKRLAEAE